MRTKRVCLKCEKSIKGHFNRKRCRSCAKELRSRPSSSLTPAEIRKASRLIGKMSGEDIANELGTSLPNLKRAFRGRRLAYYNYCQANPMLVKNVNKYFETHTQNETAKHFGISRKQVDHIIYRYRSAKPKQVRWTDTQLVEAAKMAGLVSYTAQAKYFNRPGANEGAIKSLWVKRLNGLSATLHGMPHWTAKNIVNQNARYLKPLGMSRDNRLIKFRRIILWIDMEKNLKKNVPPFIREAVETMADFQRWLFKSKNPKKQILKLIEAREC